MCRCESAASPSVKSAWRTRSRRTQARRARACAREIVPCERELHRAFDLRTCASEHPRHALVVRYEAIVRSEAIVRRIEHAECESA